MIHWSWHSLKDVILPSTLHRTKLWKKKEIVIFTSTSRVSPVTITNEKRFFISFQISVFFSIILKKMLKVCNSVQPSQIYYSLFLKNHASTSILSTKLACTFYVILVNNSICKKGIFLYWTKGIRNRNDF